MSHGDPINSEQDQRKGTKILLVDDEEGYVSVLAKRLSKRNFLVKTALSGSEAIRILRNESFDLAVLDLKMEDMDGIEVLKVFKAMEPQMPVIILTGHGSETAAREGMEYGAFDYLVKPCDLSELVARIRQACAKGG
ncbi:Response regulator receiver domain protein (CheY-like) [Syntrophobacter sp. SbD2]|nr:Response regulator receiver domain protein (CheY-like) [Syntrophobacter sp. SbD2]